MISLSISIGKNLLTTWITKSPNTYVSISSQIACYWQFRTVPSGCDPGQNHADAKLEVLIIITPELSIPVQINAKLPTCLNCVGCQQIVQWVRLYIHIILLLSRFEDKILLKLILQHPEIKY